MRVLHCMWNGETGGAERAVYLLVREQLRDPDLEPAILYAQGKGLYYEKARELGCPVIDLSLPSGGAFSRLSTVTEAMREYRIHHFHSREPLLMLGSVRCQGAARVYTHRGGRTQYAPRKRLRHELAGMMVRHYFDALSGNTVHGSRSAAHVLHVSPDRIAVTYNGLDFDLLRPRRTAHAVREELGLSPGHLVVGTVAHLQQLKRIDRLIRAAHALGRDDVRVLVIGIGPDRERLDQVVEELDFASQVMFIGSRPHIGDYLQIMDAFSLPSDENESFGNAAVEAMGMAVPTVVFSDSPGLVEHVEPGVTGFIVDDEPQLTQTLAMLLDDPALRERVGRAGAEFVRRRYTPSAAAGRYRGLYARLVPGLSQTVQEAAAARLAADVQALAIDAVCGEVIARMRDRDIRAILLKGPSFADWLYTDGTRRRYGDVDLLVSPAQAEQARDLLTELGFSLASRGEHPLRDTLRGETWHRQSDAATVDLHVRLFGAHAEPQVVWSALSAQTERQRVGGTRVEVLGPHARALHAALHAAQHGDRAAHPREDLRRALKLVDDDGWHEVATLAGQLGALPTFVAGLWMVPEGRALATRLVLPHHVPVEVMLRAGSPPPMAVGLDAVIRTPGLGPKFRLFTRLAVPSESWMRAHVPLSRRGRGGLIAAYAWRFVHLLSWGPPAIRAWLRTRKESRDG